jgi:uncharacterized protein (DUF1800 family)
MIAPARAPVLNGPAPVDDKGNAIAPQDSWGHDHLSWLDRMVRSDQPLVERMALIWHDWFATSDDKVGSQAKMLAQAELFRSKGLGTFDDLLLGVTQDPAMLIWLDGTSNSRWEPNENYAREMMELFTLGADRGAYTEADIRDQALALSGFRSQWSAELGNYNFQYDAAFHEPGFKTVFGHRGRWDWRDSCRLCVEHPLHASFFVSKLWSYFVPTPPDAATRSRLEALYSSRGRAIRPVVEAILNHPDLYTGEQMVKPPVVYTAGLLRALERPIDTEAWIWLADLSGQRLFNPPTVAGWDHEHWLDTSTLRGRWLIASYAAAPHGVDPDGYDSLEDPQGALNQALTLWGNPPLSDSTRAELLRFATESVAADLTDWRAHQWRGLRQNALRQLIAASPDGQTS